MQDSGVFHDGTVLDLSRIFSLECLESFNPSAIRILAGGTETVDQPAMVLVPHTQHETDPNALQLLESLQVSLLSLKNVRYVIAPRLTSSPAA